MPISAKHARMHSPATDNTRAALAKGIHGLGMLTPGVLKSIGGMAYYAREQVDVKHSSLASAATLVQSSRVETDQRSRVGAEEQEEPVASPRVTRLGRRGTEGWQRTKIAIQDSPIAQLVGATSLGVPVSLG
ncbi:hypothetical protein C8Q79DRAFT_986541 [Trametes meyenii]|nr:hypothetical protein C8Q79DRAFT_986541 [Trametes meyenii]